VRLFSISLRNVRIRVVSSLLTALAIVVATGLYAAIMMMAEQTRQRYDGSVGGFRTIVGPKDSSALEIVLNTIFHIGHAQGLIRLQVYSDLHEGRIGSKRGKVQYAIPQARGDSFSQFGFPVIGTTDEMFSKFARDDHALAFSQGHGFQFSHDELLQLAETMAARENALRQQEASPPPRAELQPQWKQAVVGARVARALDMQLGSEIVPVHGKPGEFGSHEHKEAACAVVGILAPTNSPIDSAIFLPLGVHFLVEGHGSGSWLPEVAAGKSPADAPVLPGDLALTAVVVGPVDHLGPMILRRELSIRPDAQATWPQEVVPAFLRQIGNIADALTVVAWLVLLVAAVSIAVAIYNTMNERRREIAIMRSLGARRLQISSIIVGEAAMLSCLGAVIGVLACHAVALLARGRVEEMTGVYLDWTAFAVREVYLVVGVTGLGACAGLLPAIKGSMTEVADNLALSY
jgi:putative ABC transport system permease protein